MSNSHCLSAAILIGLLGSPILAQHADPESAQLEAQLAALQTKLASYSGNFPPEAGEIHLQVAGVLQELGRFEEAGSAIDNALQSVRINTGLYAEEQLPILDRAINNAILEQDWDKADALFYLGMSVVEVALDVEDPRYEDFARQFASWKIQVHRNDLDVNDNALAAQDAVVYFQALLDELDESEPDYLARRIQYTTEIAMARYYAAMAISEVPVEDFESIGPETISGQNCFTITEDTGSGPRPVRVCETKQMPNPLFFESRQKAKFETLESHISWIRASFLELIEDMEADPQTDPVQLAQVVLTLGDMNFLLNDSLRAKTQYARAFEILNNNGVAAEIQMQLMGQPREISETTLASMGLPLIQTHAIPSGIVAFDVTPEGTIRNLGITGSGADLEQANQQLITSILRQSVYRPKLEAGQPVEARIEIPAAQL